MVPPGIWSHWGSSLRASHQPYRNWASFTSFNFKLLLSFHLVFLRSHHRWPLVWYKHFKSRPYDCLHSPKRDLKTSCCCCFLRTVWNPQSNNPDGWPGLLDLAQKDGEWRPLLRPQLSLSHGYLVLTWCCWYWPAVSRPLDSEEDERCIKAEWRCCVALLCDLLSLCLFSISTIQISAGNVDDPPV